MNFLAEVLSSAEKIEIDEINKKVPELKLKVDNLKNDLIQYNDNVYIKFTSLGCPIQNQKLLSKSQNLEEKIESLKKNAENATKKELVKPSEKFIKHVETLDSLSSTLHILSTVFKINEQFEELTSFYHDNEFFKCKRNIDCIKYLVTEIPDDENLIGIDQLKSRLKERNTLLLNKIRQCFQNKVIPTRKENVASLKITCDFHPLDQALLAMFYNESVVNNLKELGQFLWDNFFVPIVNNVVFVKVNKNSIFSSLDIEFIDTTKKSSYKEIFNNLKIVIEFLQTSFNFNLTNVDPLVTTLEYIGKDIGDNLSDLIVKHFLVDTIPFTVEECKQYKLVIEDTEKLEAALRESKLFSSDTASLLEYVNKLDLHFINKMYEEYLVQSQHIMMKDLHDMIEVGAPYNPDNSMVSVLDEFLQCSISKSVKELLDFCESILQRAISDSAIIPGITCQKILRKYATFVPDYHSESLKTIPQQVALFHNNCFYISHNLKHFYKSYLSKTTSTLNLSINSFGDEINILRQVGSETLSVYVKGQIRQIIKIMQNSGLDNTLLKEDIKLVAEKSVMQCLRQQELLKTVWHKVLSNRVYNESMGLILNSLCTCLINPIINYEEISINTAEQLVDIIKIVIIRGSQLFTDPKEVNLYVKLWYKLSELSFVLSASLVDINDRWADGIGPLAVQFKPSELKSLIKALFQSNDKRSEILVKIQ